MFSKAEVKIREVGFAFTICQEHHITRRGANAWLACGNKATSYTGLERRRLGFVSTDIQALPYLWSGVGLTQLVVVVGIVVANNQLDSVSNDDDDLSLVSRQCSGPLDYMVVGVANAEQQRSFEAGTLPILITCLRDCIVRLVHLRAYGPFFPFYFMIDILWHLYLFLSSREPSLITLVLRTAFCACKDSGRTWASDGLASQSVGFLLGRNWSIFHVAGGGVTAGQLPGDGGADHPVPYTVVIYRSPLPGTACIFLGSCGLGLRPST